MRRRRTEIFAKAEPGDRGFRQDYFSNFPAKTPTSPLSEASATHVWVAPLEKQSLLGLLSRASSRSYWRAGSRKRCSRCTRPFTSFKCLNRLSLLYEEKSSALRIYWQIYFLFGKTQKRRTLYYEIRPTIVPIISAKFVLEIRIIGYFAK